MPQRAQLKLNFNTLTKRLVAAAEDGGEKFEIFITFLSISQMINVREDETMLICLDRFTISIS